MAAGMPIIGTGGTRGESGLGVENMGALRRADGMVLQPWRFFYVCESARLTAEYFLENLA
jgi:hypothetical protein